MKIQIGSLEFVCIPYTTTASRDYDAYKTITLHYFRDQETRLVLIDSRHVTAQLDQWRRQGGVSIKVFDFDIDYWSKRLISIIFRWSGLDIGLYNNPDPKFINPYDAGAVTGLKKWGGQEWQSR